MCEACAGMSMLGNNLGKSGWDKIKETLLCQAQKLTLSSIGDGKSCMSITMM